MRSQTQTPATCTATPQRAQQKTVDHRAQGTDIVLTTVACRSRVRGRRTEFVSNRARRHGGLQHGRLLRHFSCECGHLLQCQGRLRYCCRSPPLCGRLASPIHPRALQSRGRMRGGRLGAVQHSVLERRIRFENMSRQWHNHLFRQCIGAQDDESGDV